MKKVLLSLLALVASTLGAVAGVINITPEQVTYAETSGNYISSATVASAAPDEPRVTITANANNMDKREKAEYLLWHSGSAQSGTYTFTVEDGYVITGISLTAAANSNDQTVTLGSTTLTFTSADYDTFVAAPAPARAQTITLTGANTGLKVKSIQITYDVAASGIASKADLNDHKSYTFGTERGLLGVNNGTLVSTAKGFEASEFAVITYNDKQYLYSVQADKFVGATGALDDNEPGEITIQELGNSLFKLFYGTNCINVSGGYPAGLVINNWSTSDPGNQYTIIEGADFDPTDAIYKLEHPTVFTSVADLADLSNNKAYLISNARGTLFAAAGATSIAVAAVKDLESEGQRFAIISEDGKYYLYSVAAEGFLRKDGSLGYAQPVEITPIDNAEEPVFFFKFDDQHNINVSSGIVIIDTWSEVDEGNSNAIIEAGDFDPTKALERLHYNAKDLVRDNVQPFFAEHGGLFQLTEEAYAANIDKVNLALVSSTLDEYEQLLAVVQDANNFVLPKDGERYVIKNVSTGKYINVQASAAGSIKADTDVPLVSSVVTTIERNGHIYFGTQGLEFGWTYGTTNKALLDAAGGGKYAHFAISAPGVVAFAHSLGDGEGQYAGYLATAYYAVQEDGVVAGGQATDDNAKWVFEPAQEVNLALNGSDNLATLYAPFDLVLNGAVAYTVKVDGETAYLNELGTEVPALTPVVIKGEAATATATIDDGLLPVAQENALTGNMLAAHVDGYVLNESIMEEAGFYLLSEEGKLAANKAYIALTPATENEPAEQPAEEVKIVFGNTNAVNSIVFVNEAQAPVYNLAGQRVTKAQKGIFITRGKKVIR